MRSVLAAFTLAVLVVPAWSNAETPLPPAASNFPKMFVGRPEFSTKLGERGAGTSFLAKFENRAPIYLLTVRHLLGPSGGFPQLIKAEEVPSFVSAIRLRYLFTAGAKSFRVEGLSVPATDDSKGPLFNVAIFRTNDASLIEAATLSAEEPAPGEAVWVLAHVRGGVPEGQYIHSAHVREYRGRW